jgi:hypothetical protein
VSAPATDPPETAAAPRVPLPVPSDVQRAMRRGRGAMKRDAAKRRLCMRFERGDTFFFVNERNQLDNTPTVTAATGGGKPPHKIRNSYNFIRPIVDDKVSAATQRVPNFEIDPSTTDPEDAGAAKLSEKVSIYGYYQWHLRGVAIDATKTAVAHGGSSYTLPYWEPNVGPYTYVDGKWIGQGDVRLLVFNGNECYWEAGCKFDTSPWWAVERARLISDVKNTPGYVGGTLAPDDDDDLGLVWQLIDFQRAAQDCVNKMLEYKNRGLNLQMLAPVNSLITRPDDVPNSVRYYKLSPNGEKPEWENPPSGQILNALQQIFNLIIEQMQRVASYEDVQAEPNVAARTTQAVIEQSMARWQSFLGDLAEWWSAVMRHCLNLVACFYTEPRTLDIRGRMGWESIADFKGAKLMGQTNVRVSPGSLEYLTRAQILSKVQYYAAMGWVTGERAMSAVEGGMAEKLTEGYDQDVAKVNRIMGRIRDGSVMDMPTRSDVRPVTDPITGQQQMVPMDVPIWMPNEWDNIKVWQQQLALWLKTQDFELLCALHPDRAEVAKLMWSGLEQLQQQEALRAAQQQQQMATQLGLGNAAAPQLPPSLPSVPNAAGMPASGQNTPGSGPGPGPNAA